MTNPEPNNPLKIRCRNCGMSALFHSQTGRWISPMPTMQVNMGSHQSTNPLTSSFN